MSSRLVFSLGLLLVAGVLATAPPASAKIKVDAELMKSLDPDNNGSVTLDEAKIAAAAEFKKLDTNNDGTLDAKELKGRLDKSAIKKANPNGAGTLDLNAYTAIVEKKFKAADPNNDGTLSEAELKSKKGQKFLKLV